MVKTIPLIKRNEKIVDCFLKVKKDYLKFLSKEKIFDQPVATKIAHLRRIYIPMSFWIDKKYKKKRKTLFLGLSGGQGSGKTTVTGILKIILKNILKEKSIQALLMIFTRHWKNVIKYQVQFTLCSKQEGFLVHMT